SMCVFFILHSSSLFYLRLAAHPDLHSFPTTLFRSRRTTSTSRPCSRSRTRCSSSPAAPWSSPTTGGSSTASRRTSSPTRAPRRRSEEHTSELQSRENLVCRLLLEKKKKINYTRKHT